MRLCGFVWQAALCGKGEASSLTRQKAPKHKGTTTHGAGKRNAETQTSHKQRLRDKTLHDVMQNSSSTRRFVGTYV